jgi:hypothetical protein
MALSFSAVCVLGATFTTDTLIDAGNNSFEGQELVVQGCTLTVDGTHSFGNVLLTNAAVLTHSPALDGDSSKQLNLTVTRDVAVDFTSRIDVRGQGYGSASGPGAGASSIAWGGDGGSHGGIGGIGSGGETAGTNYGSISLPTQHGSGGGNGYNSSGGPGGGLIRMNVGGTLRLDGALLADGADGAGYTYGGGGSAGSIALTVGNLAGNGTISACGGMGGLMDGGGGGGGRIAIHCAGSQLFRGPMRAYGGAGAQYGGAGTIYLRVGTAENGDVLVDNGGNAGQYTPLMTVTPFNLTLANRAVAYPQQSLTNASLTIKTNALLTHLPGRMGFNISVISNLVIEAGGAIDVSGCGFGMALGPGAGGRSLQGGAGGGGHGGNGGSANGPGGGAYDSIVAPVQFGSGGGRGYFSSGGNGGGAVQLTVGQVLQVDGTLIANGSDISTDNLFGGGGAGGSLYLTVARLAGRGWIAANGGGSSANGGGGGAGGRIAIHCGSNDFSGALSAYGGSGASRGGAGTIFTKFATAPRGQVLIHNGGNSNGVTRLNTALWPSDILFDLVLAGAAVMTPDMPLTLYSFVVLPGATARPDPEMPLEIVTMGDLRVNAGGSITADGLGYGSATGPGAGGSSGDWAGGGGGYGGWGGSITNGAPGGIPYGSSTQPLEMGSGGGRGYFSRGGFGGGAIRLSVGGILYLDGTISANGGPGLDYIFGGGGSGGGIFLTAGIVTGTGSLSATGGTSYWGGGGSGGRIAVSGTVLVNLPNQPIVSSGLSGDGSVPSENGRVGTVSFSTNLPPFQVVAMVPGGTFHPFSNIVVRFNEGVYSNRIAASDISISTPQGMLPNDQISVRSAGGAVFVVGFPLQSAEGGYSLRVGPNIQDLYGRKMDQNANGVQGEPADVFTGNFSLGAQVNLSGRVSLTNGMPAENVAVRVDGIAAAVTDADGNYSLALPQGWSGTVAPWKTGCQFLPASRSYTSVLSDQSAQNYTLNTVFAPALRINVRGSDMHVQWASVAGVQYQVQTSEDLVTWLPGPSVTGSGDVMTWTWDMASHPVLFVRIVANN